MTELFIYTPTSIEIIINNLYKFTNLEHLHLYDNAMKEIRGLDILVNLQILNLNYNQISEIKGLYNLVNLEELKNLTNLKKLNIFITPNII